MESDSDLESLPDSDPEHNVPLVPCNIARAAAEGDLEEVRWWLEGHDSDDERDWVNAEDEDLRGMTLLLHACTGPEQYDRYEPRDDYESRDDEAYVDLVRYLIPQGANVHHVADEDGPPCDAVKPRPPLHNTQRHLLSARRECSSI